MPRRGSCAARPSSQDTYRVQALLAGYEKDKDSAAAVLWQATQAASAEEAIISVLK